MGCEEDFSTDITLETYLKANPDRYALMPASDEMGQKCRGGLFQNEGTTRYRKRRRPPASPVEFPKGNPI
jgi:hypothetical protein